MKQRSTTRPPAPARAFSELDAILLDYVIEAPPSKAPRTPGRRAEMVEHIQRRRWSFERAALRQSTNGGDTPWFVTTDKRLAL